MDITHHVLGGSSRFTLNENTPYTKTELRMTTI